MKPLKSRKAELAPNATGGGKSHAEAAESAEFKMTELGLIPVDWEVKRFDDAYSFAAASDLQKEWYSPIQDARHKYCIYSNGLANNGLYGYTSRPRYNGNSITITGRGTLGHAEFRHDDFDAIIRLLILTPIVEVDNQFVVYWINNYKPFVNESTSIPQLTVPQVACKLFPLPPLAEQRRIAGALSDVDELISALGELIEKKRNIKTGAMQQLLTGKTRLPGFGEKYTEFKQTELGLIPIDWEVKRLGEVVEINPPCFKCKPTRFVYVDLESVKDGKLLSRNYIDSCDAPSRAQRQFAKNDILYQTVRPYQCNNMFVDFDAEGYVASTGYAIIRANKSDARYVYVCLCSAGIVSQVLDNCTGTSYPAINPEKLADIKVIVPPTLAEQKAIAAVLSDMDAEIAALEADRAKYERIKSGMMQELLTGKTRLEA